MKQCQQQIANAYYCHAGLYACRLDYYRLLGLCGRCGGTVDDDNCRKVTLEWGGQAKFHVEHVVGDCCATFFGSKDTVYQHMGRFYCVNHICVACRTPVGTFEEGKVYQYINGGTGGWIHGRCHEMKMSSAGGGEGKESSGSEVENGRRLLEVWAVGLDVEEMLERD